MLKNYVVYLLNSNLFARDSVLTESTVLSNEFYVLLACIVKCHRTFRIVKHVSPELWWNKRCQEDFGPAMLWSLFPWWTGPKLQWEHDGGESTQAQWVPVPSFCLLLSLPPVAVCWNRLTLWWNLWRVLLPQLSPIHDTPAGGWMNWVWGARHQDVVTRMWAVTLKEKF